ncbi:MAG TPA: tetratricopeptide repeat protein, partial [Myxococcaceae bacterium]|nr:tetratricopeptide repeat protein [Myxococcaceae bacterium]
MATRARAEAVDEEFLYALYRGGELLGAGKVIEAKDHLERAFKLQPKNEKAQNLLGLTYFKLGLFDRAAEIYEMLVRENPADPTLRVNLGLVYLKTNALQRAIREFEVATDLAPEHKKSQNYLGLALAQAGEYGRAREHFLLAGSDAMALKMERALTGEPVLKPDARANGASSGNEPVESDVVAPPEDEQTGADPDPAPVQIDLMSDDQAPPEEPPAKESSLHGEASWVDQFGLEGEAPSTSTPPPASDEDDGLEDALAARPGAVAEAPRLPDAAPVAMVLESTPSAEEEPEEVPAEVHSEPTRIQYTPVGPDELEAGETPIPLVR